MDFDRSPVKAKKQKPFKFLHKRDKDEKEDKKDDKRRGKEEKKEERKKEKEEKLRAKEEKKKMKKDKKKKHMSDSCFEDPTCAVFGVALCQAVERSPSHDGVRLPVVVRQCIDFIEEQGLTAEGIYRLSGVKSKVQHLRRLFNSATPVDLTGQDPHVVASLLKQFLRELPEPVLTVDMTSHFEDASQIPGSRDRAETIRQLLLRLPCPNSTLVHYILAHMGHIIEREADTRMNFQNVCIVLSPTMRISHRVLNVFFQNHNYLFGEVVIMRYIPPMVNGSEIEGVTVLEELQEEVRRQEGVLSHLHRMLASSPHNTTVQERLWEAQRILTLLKRKIKVTIREESEAKGIVLPDEGSSEESQRDTISNNSHNSVSLATTASESHHESYLKTQTVLLQSEDASQSKSNAQEIPRLPKPLSGRGERTRNSSSGVQVNSHQVNTEEKTHSETKSDRENKKELGVQQTKLEGCDKLSRDKEFPVGEICTAVDVFSVQEVKNKVSTLPEVKSKVFTIPEVKSKVSTVHETKSKVSTIQDVKSKVSTGHEIKSKVSTVQEVNPMEHGDEVKSLKTPKMTLRETRSLEENLGTVCVDAELVSLVREEAHHLAHHAELLAMNHDLSRKLLAEREEISKLKEEIQEMQTLYGYRTYSYDSSDSEGVEGSDTDSDSEEDLLLQLQHLQKHNSHLESHKMALVARIQQEREAVVMLKAKLRQTSVLVNSACC